MTLWISRLKRRVRALILPQTVDQDVAEEMRAHIEYETLSLVQQQGLSHSEARRQAMISFGGVERFTEEHRDARGVQPLREFAEDLRYSARTLRRSPGFSISAILVLALGIGASAAMFSAVDAVILAHLPYENDEQLVRIFEQNSPTNRWTLSVVDIQAIEQHAKSFSALGALRLREVGVTAGKAPERQSAGFINAGFITALGVRVAAGRALLPDDERPESPAVVVLGHTYATREFGSPPNALNAVVTVDGIAHRVVGVLGASETHLGYFRADLWPILRRSVPNRRGPFGIFSIARLKPGVSVEAAKRELNDISLRIYPDWQAGFADKSARLTPYSLRETVIGNTSGPMWLFSSSVALVLLIAISNVASLSIVRSIRRWREVSLRAMLGASRNRLVRMMVTESVVLATAGETLGLAIAWAGLKALQQFAVGIPRLGNASIDGRTVAVAMTLSVIAGLAIGVVPAFRLLRRESDNANRAGSRTVGDGEHSHRLRSTFVAAEFALALPVLAAGALLLNSLMNLQRVDPGFDVQGVQTVRISVPSAAYADNTDLSRFWKRAAANVSQLPGVIAAGFSTAIAPTDNGRNVDNYDVVEAPVPTGSSQPTVTWPSVSNEFFTALGIKLIEGRLFMPTDTGGIPAVVVTQSWVKRHFAGRSALGRELIRGGCVQCPHTVIVGVVSDITFDQLNLPGDAVFSPVDEGWPSQMFLYVKTASGDPSVAQRVRDAVRAAGADAAFGVMTPLEESVYESMAQPRHWATILLVFAGASLLMAAVGVFGLLSYAVELRRREIGVRMALGAASRTVVSSMVLGGMRYAAGGAAVGVVLTLVASRWLRSMLFGVSAFDPLTLASVTTGLLAVGFVASWLPARRAANIDPVEAMRPE